VSDAIPPGLLADIYRKAVQLLQEHGWHPHADGQDEDGGGARHSAHSAIEAAVALTLAWGMWECPGEQARTRFAGFLYLTRRLGRNSPYALGDMVTAWELNSVSRLTQEQVIEALSECAALIDPTDTSEKVIS
jgi:hypothetical protein